MATRSRRPRSTQNIQQTFDQMHSEYRMAKSGSRFRSVDLGTAALGVGASIHTKNDHAYFRMMEMARHFEINDPLIGVAIRRLTTNVLRDGFRLNPKTGSKDVDDLLKKKWQDWSTNKTKCDIRRKHNFHTLATLALRRVIVDGDMVFLPLKKTGQLQALEGHRLRTPRNAKRRQAKAVPIHGVEPNPITGAVRQYWFTKEDVDTTQTVERVDDMTQRLAWDDADNPLVLHLYLPERFTQYRGVTALARVDDLPGQLDDIRFAKLVAMQTQSCWSVLRQRDLGFTAANNRDTRGDDEDLGEIDEVHDPGWDHSEVDLAPGMVYTGKEGETLSAFSPNVNAGEFAEMSELILGIMAVNLDVPLTDLLYDGTKTNFSGERAITQKARERYSELQTWLIDELYRPVFEWLVRRWVREDATLAAAVDDASVDVFAHSWNRPVWPYIDPLKDATADNVQLSNGHESPVRYHAKRHGRDFDEFYIETVNAYGDAIEFAMARAEEINARFPTHPTTVSWQNLLPLPTPEGIVINATSVDSTPNAPNQSQQ